MPTIRSHTEIARPVHDVWTVWSDVRRLPELSPSTTAVQDAPERLTEVGQTFRQLAELPGRTLDVTWTVTAIEADDHLVIEGSPVRGVRVAISEAVAAIDDEHTRLTLTIDYRLPFGPIGRAVNRMGLERRAQREATQVVEGVVALVMASRSA